MAVEIVQAVSQIDIVEQVDGITVNETTLQVELVQPSIIEAAAPRVTPLVSAEFDLDATGSAIITIPATEIFWPSMVSVYVTQLNGTLTSQPVISIGVTADLTKYRNALLATSLDILSNRESIDIATSADGDNGISGTNFVVTIATAGVKNSATIYKGKLIVEGTRVANG